MENFQLYRTNLNLSGQMKWDIIVDSSEANLIVSDFHLRPLSDNIPYTYKTDEKLLNNNHQDNVKIYYKSIQGNFYNEGLNETFNHEYPIICKEGEIIDAYSNIYDMGCKRMKQYSLYNRQFEFFCPVWIEKLEESISFKFIIKAHGSDSVLSSKTLNISKKLYKDSTKYHDRFVSYFDKYIDDSGLRAGDDNMLNIRFSDDKTVVTGLNVSTGMFCNKHLIGFTSDLKSIERPMLETDSMLVKAFSGNNIVSKQLFNFNLCFNLSDIISDVIFNMINGEKLTVDLEVYVDGNKLIRKDFYTNYEFIDRSVKNAEDNNKYNVFDYLKDYQSHDLVSKNKFCQSICHWSLLNNDEYIFNLYNGFSSLYVEKADSGEFIYHENEHQYKDFPNLMSETADIAINSTGWINTEKIEYWNSFYKYIHNTEKNKKKGTYINKNLYINGIKYHDIPSISIGDNEGLYLIGLHVTNNILLEIKNNITRLKLVSIPIGDKVLLVRKDDLVMFVTTDDNNLTYKNMGQTFNDLYDSILHKIYMTALDTNEDTTTDVNVLSLIKAVLCNAVSPEIIIFDKTLRYTETKGPSKDVKEIDYIETSESEYVCRYDGKMRPSFVSEKMNELYFKDYVSDNRINGTSKLVQSPYMKYINSGYTPSFPSIDYFAIKKINEWKYNKLPEVITSEGLKPLLNNIEYSWFEDNVCLILIDNLKFIKENRLSEGYKSLEEILKECISEKYNTTDENQIKYIISKYNIESNWEYKSITNVDDYIYNITLSLK